MAKAKEYLNVVNAPLLRYPDWTLLSDIYDIPGLHCMTGIIAKLIGQDSFEGNHARQLLKVINRMRLDVENLSEETDVDKHRIMRIINTIEAFDWVVESCFSKELIGDYEGAIKSFSKLYTDLHNNFRVSVTVKVHLVMRHVIPQINKRHPGFRIGVLTEQSFESAHHEFKLEWQKTKLP